MTLTLPNGMILSGTVDEIKEFIDKSTPYQSSTASPSTGIPYVGNMSYSIDYLKCEPMTSRFGMSEIDYDKPIHEKLKEAKNYKGETK